MTTSKSLSPLELRQQIDAQERASYLIQDFIPSKSLCILAGDSGKGKTPFAIQLGICVAAGIPFLGFPVSQGTVIYADFENNAKEFLIKCEEISQALGLATTPENFRRLEFPTATTIEMEVRLHDPKLIVVDTLRFMDAKAESEAHAAAIRMTWMKQQNQRGASTIFLHHLRKDDKENPRPDLDDLDTPVLTWMQNVSGSLALINQSDIRIGFENSRKEDQVIVRTNRRGFGEIAPWQLERIFDDASGEPVAYKMVVGISLLTRLQQECFLKLQPGYPLTFTEALQLIGKSRRFAADLLKAAISAKILVKQGTAKDTRYVRVR